MSRMLHDADDYQRNHIKRKQIHGIEAREDMFSIATTNMILRGDGQSNLLCGDFFAHDADKLQRLGATVGFMNPPYSQAKNSATAHLSELRFVRHLLDSITRGGRVAVIVPVSAMIGKTSDDKLVKGDILRGHTLEGVISLNKNTFYRIGTVPCVAVFTAGEPHPKSKRVKFINFEDDGFEVKKHVGLVETERAKDRKFYLLDCWRGKIKDAPSKFMVETTIEPQDEWLHSFYYYNDELPTADDVRNTIADYLTFEFNMIAHGREYLFCKKKLPLVQAVDAVQIVPLNQKRWRAFRLLDYFDFIKGDQNNMAELTEGDLPLVSAKDNNNGYKGFVSQNNKKIYRGNCLTLNNDGSGAGIAYYQPADMLLDTHVTALYPKQEMSRATILFIARSITTQREKKFAFGYTVTNKRLSLLRINLPVNETDEPDFDYMEAYVRAVEAEKYRRYLAWIEGYDA